MPRMSIHKVVDFGSCWKSDVEAHDHDDVIPNIVLLAYFIEHFVL